MIGAALIIVAVAVLLFTVSMIDPAKDLVGAVIRLLDGIEDHRRAQGISVLHHSGLLDDETERSE